MSPSEAKEIIDLLASGIDPKTGEVLPPESPLNDLDVTRALFIASKHLQQTGVHKKTRASGSSKTMAGKPWSEQEDKSLLQAFEKGSSPRDLAAIHQRTRGAIVSRLTVLGAITRTGTLRQ